jgi:hypothetical protein
VHPKTLTGVWYWRFEVRPVPARMIDCTAVGVASGKSFLLDVIVKS